MRYSQTLGKTLKKSPQEAEAISHQLLIRAGFIDRSLAAGIYSFLPLGFRVQKKIEEIIREEMNAVGGQEVFLPTLQPKDLWLKTNRWNFMDPPLFKLKDRHGRELALGATHEEVITDIIRKRVKSYKDLPLSLYQIQNKFRNEMRATGGLLRTREFLMKDMYSFHATEEEQEKYYQKVKAAYIRIFTRFHLKVKVVEALSGSIGGEINHEFHLLCPTGEDRVIFCQKCPWAANIEVIKEKGKETECPKCGGETKIERSIESGHIFNLGTKYSKAMGAYFVDRQGKKKPILMGCYGIGLGRLIATIVEVHHDKKGIIWPQSVAPYQGHLIELKTPALPSGRQNAKVKSPSQKSKVDGEKVYRELLQAGIEVLWDDREDVSAGEKFADADLIGIPARLVVSEKTLRPPAGGSGQAGNRIEWKNRESEKAELLSLNEIITRLVG